MSHILAIDGGTESIRVAVFAPDGRCLGIHAAPYGTEFGAAGVAEQLPGEWWSALKAAVPAALSAAGLEPRDISAICIDTTCCTLLAVDADGSPLRPAMLWMDVRAADEAREISATGDPFLVVNGAGETPVSAEWMIPKALWLKRHEPDIYRRAAIIYDYQDHLNRLLTGRICGSRSGMAGRWHYLPDKGGWPLGLYRAVGLEDIVEKLPREVLGPGEIVGPLLASSAKALGLRAGTPVFQGGADAYLAVIGMNVTLPGELALVTGSSHLHLAIADQPFNSRGILGTFRDAVYDGKWLIDGGQTSTGSALAWFKRQCARDVDFDTLNQLAAAIPIGSDGVVALDHLQGNRSPYSDAGSRGAFIGIALNHTTAHLYRALMEAICCGTSLIVDNYRAQVTINRVVACGGATNSPLWMQMHADMLGLPIEVPEFKNAPLLGCAVVGAWARGDYPSIEAAASAMVRIGCVYQPDASTAEPYRAVLARYSELYAALHQLRQVSTTNRRFS